MDMFGRDAAKQEIASYPQLLRDDDSLLRQIFFGVLRHHHPNLVRRVLVTPQMALSRRGYAD